MSRTVIDVLLLACVCLYALGLLFVSLYTIAQAQLLWRYLRKRKPEEVYLHNDSFRPFVTIQLPVYNERYVVERLIDAVCRIRYPRHLLEIQVLDDSTDETTTLAAAKAAEWNAQGVEVIHIRRPNRKGFKAGALKHGLATARGECIAIFDADFVPGEDFLEKTLPYFADEKTGMVQTRWGHINRNYSILTRLQAFALDAHFTVEQVGRNMGGFINFNGTAGIWRKAAIEDAGNWEDDTLTEDLDLSYRAQLKNWQFIYLEDTVSPAELPPVMSALKSQQYRWTKGGAEVAKKHLANVIKSPFSFGKKWHGALHLLNSAVFISVIITSLTSVPLLFAKRDFPSLQPMFLVATVFLLSFVVLGAMYYVSSRSYFRSQGQGVWQFLYTFPVFLSVSMGLSLHNAVAVIEGYAGRKTPFVRTPKFNIHTQADRWKGNVYLRNAFTPLVLAEALLMGYFVYGIVTGIRLGDYGLLPFHAMLAAGFGAVFVFSVFPGLAVRSGEDKAGVVSQGF
ncbi:MAG: glycosyltransferase [Bacteroidia bacterium]|jgi:cellulose synthase/poly-beta-1,6-N-acetylglucosamine synthase-like glycosyltransferase|nr:glycosyltransferase [Bacteroidia bacterium]